MKECLNVLMVATSLNYKIRGGLSRHTYELCKALKKLGHQVYVSCIDNAENTVVNIENKMLMPSFPITFFDLIGFNMSMLNKLGFDDIDVIHSQGDHGFIFGLVRKRPLVATVHGLTKEGLSFVPGYRYHFSPYGRILTERCIIKRADKIIVVSRSLGKRVRTEYGLEDERIVHIPNGVDLEKFNADINGEKIREKYGINGPLLLCVTRLESGRLPWKLFPVIKAVAKEIPDIKLVLVGDGPLIGRLRNMRDREGLSKNVILTGGKDDSELPYFYAASDLFVLPMVYPPPKKELTVLEAMACGKTVIYSQVEPKAGKIVYDNPVYVSNEKDFASSIIYLLQNEKKRKELGLAGRRTAEFFSWRKVAEKTVEVYGSLL